MAIALVSLGSAAVGLPSNPQFGQATTAGNLLIAWTKSDGTTTCSNGSWSLAIKGNFGGAPEIWYKANCSSGEVAPTFSGSNTVTTFVTQLAEFSGAALSSPLELSVKERSAFSTSPVTVTTAAADANAGNLLVAASLDSLSKAGTSTTAHSYNNGATASSAYNDDATSAATHARFSYGITTSNAAADSVTASSSSMNLSYIYVVLVSFKVATVASENPVFPYVGGGYYGG